MFIEPGFQVEVDVGINASFVPVWIFRMLFVLRVLKVQIRGSSDHLFFSKVSTVDSNGSQIDSSVFFGSNVESDVEVDEGSAQA